MFEVSCAGKNCHSQGKGEGVGIVTAVTISGLFKGVGLTSSTVSITQGGAISMYINICNTHKKQTYQSMSV